MNQAEYMACDGLEIARLVRMRQVSRREVLDAAMQAIGQLNPGLNALIEIYADVLESGGDAGSAAPFAGVPFALKDLACHERGRVQESGSRLFRGMVAPYDTDLMLRFRAAGLVNLGRTPSPEMGWNVSTEPLLHGPVRNPWQRAHTAGGSSGGAAAAVASGMLPVAHATDGGGSIRIPAAWCGLVGLKPTRGRIPTGPDMGDPINGLGVEFALTRSVRDCAALLDCVAIPGAGEYSLAPRPADSFAACAAQPPRALRIAFTTRPWTGVPVQDAMRDATLRTAELCRELGHRVEEASPAFDADAFMHASTAVWCANIASGIDAMAGMSSRKVDLDLLEATVRACYLFGREMRATELLEALAIFNTVSRAVGAFFERHDVLLTPAVACTAPKLGVLNANDPSHSAHGWTEHIFGHAPFTALWNTTGQPAISLPAGLDAGGLPMGVQFVGRFADEGTLLSLATQLEAARPWPRIAPLPGAMAASGPVAAGSSRP